MKKHLRLPIVFELKEYPEQSVFKLRLGSEALRDWCLGLSLLKDRMIEALIVSDEQGRKEVEIQVLSTTEITARTQADFRRETAQLKTTPNQLDYLLSFFLKYYRDGIAEVDHIDLEATATGTKNEDAYIIFTVPDFVPPMTPQELEKRLKMGS